MTDRQNKVEGGGDYCGCGWLGQKKGERYLNEGITRE